MHRCLFMKSKWLVIGMLILLGASGCIAYDESTYITDDDGHTHHTTHYLLDTRGRTYFPKQIPATGVRTFVFDPKAYAWVAYDEMGQRVMTGSASGGQDMCKDVGKPCRTVTGTFRVYNKRGINCKSGEYPVETEGGAKMPYCMYFFQGYTIHAAYDVPRSGTFRVYNKRGINCKSGEYPVETEGGAKMPYCMYFFQGYTIHAAYDVP